MSRREAVLAEMGLAPGLAPEKQREKTGDLWIELKQAVRPARHAASQDPKQTVLGVGDERRRCVIGEAPGAEETGLGEPFVGRPGGCSTLSPRSACGEVRTSISPTS